MSTVSVAAEGAKPVTETSSEVSVQEPFSGKDLREALGKVNSPRIMQELTDLVSQRITYETGRQQRIDGKASSLLTASGVSVSLALTFSGVLARGHFKADLNYLLWAFGVALLFGLVAAGIAIWTLSVSKGYAAPSNHALFSKTLLQKADLEHDPENTAEPESLVDEWRLMVYQKGLVEHFWDIAEKHSSTHDRKAKILQWGQRAFGCFLLAIAVVCVLVGHALLTTTPT